MATRIPVFEAAAMAVWIHGRAGQIAGAGAIADDVGDALRAVMAAGPEVDGG